MVWINVRHHARALWGFGLKLDPDYPEIFRFCPTHIRDTVFEYRSYGVVAGWAVLLVLLLPVPLLIVLEVWFVIQTARRVPLYASELAWWAQAAKESPRKTRVLNRYAEALMREINRRYTAGESWESLAPLIEKATSIQDRLVSKAEVNK